MIKKAVIPAAGYGTRFLPATKVQPKEMMPIIDTPVIQYVVQEAIDSGIDDILIITGRGKQAISNHFDRTLELEMMLEAQGKEEQLRQIRDISEMANIHFIRQKEQKGLGDAILYARQHVDDQPFVVLLGDTVIDGPTPCAKQLMDLYGEKITRPIVAVEQVDPEKVSRYGIISGREVAPNTYEVDRLVEKPRPEDAPSNLAISSRYLLTPEIFEELDRTPRGRNNELQLTDALNAMAEREPIFAYKYEGKRHDIGNVTDYLKTSIEFALRRADIGPGIRKFIRGLQLEPDSFRREHE